MPRPGYQQGATIMQLHLIPLIQDPIDAAVKNFVFFDHVLQYLREQVQQFGIDLLGRVMGWVGAAALTLLTLWILIQGYRIVTGQAKDSMALMMVNAAKAAFIVTVATSMAVFGVPLHTFVSENLRLEIAQVVTGVATPPEKQIDKNLAVMTVALGSIDVLDTAGDPTIEDDKNRAMLMVGAGIAGPAIVGGSLLLLYEVAMALFIGLGPIFILMLLFDATKQMFWKWLWYGIGTLFSMAVLAAMVSISLDVVWRVAAKMWGDAVLGSLLGVRFNDGMSSVAMQQGGLGMILSVLIMGTPPIAAMFFQGTVANFGGYNAMAQFASGGAGAAAMRPGPGGQMVPAGGGYVNQAPSGVNPTDPGVDKRASGSVLPDLITQNATRHAGSAQPHPQDAIKTGDGARVRTPSPPPPSTS